MRRRYIIIAAALTIIAAIAVVLLVPRDSSPRPSRTKIRLRLQWIPQCQFAGFIVAKEKRFYEQAGLDVQLLPAGPDLKPQVTVAAGTDQIGVGVPNHIIAARSNNVPLVAIAQIFQDSANRYVLKAENRIDDLSELKGKKVGLWLGGDEAEFISMLATAGMTLDDVQVIPQEFSVIPFLQDRYVLSQVTVYNELILIRDKGYQGDNLQVLSPKDYDSAILGDVLFTTEKYLAEHPQAVQAFLEASIRGWKYCLDHQDEALEIVLAYNPELDRDHQRKQLDAVLALLVSGAAADNGIGFINTEDYATAVRVLFDSGQISTRVRPESCVELTAWRAVPESVTSHN